MNEIRETCVRYLKSYLEEEQAYKLEKQIYQITKKEFAYKQMARLYLNALRRKTWSYDGNLCSPYDLHKKRWLPFQKAEETMDTIVAEQMKPASTSMYTCGKCKNNKCTFYTAQLRSADEGTDVFVTCLNCNHKWKQ